MLITPELLRGWPLPQPEGEVDKETRGRVLIIGGALEMPGAIVLAGNAALRAGAGKLQIATCRGVARLVGITVPEARVFHLPETGEGGIDPSSADQLAENAARAKATLVGPGMVDRAAVRDLMRRLLPRLEDTVLVLDAMAMECAAEMPDAFSRLGGDVILTPNAGEMASMLGIDKAEVTREPLAVARRAASKWQAVVALKGSETYMVAPGGQAYRFRSGNIGMATSGSGDTLAGVVVGLAARGAEPLQALVWGVYLHGTAGDRLARRMGRLGYLPRELLAEVPLLMAELDPPAAG